MVKLIEDNEEAYRVSPVTFRTSPSLSGRQKAEEQPFILKLFLKLT